MDRDLLVEILLAFQYSLDARLKLIETLKATNTTETAAEANWNLGYSQAIQDTARMLMLALDGYETSALHYLHRQKEEILEYAESL